MSSPVEYIVPPTFSASQYMSARHLNIIEHDLGVLFGVSMAPPMCFSGIQYQTGGDHQVSQQFARWRLEHQYNDMTIRFALKTATSGCTASGSITIAPSESGATASDLVTFSSGSTDWEYAGSTLDLSSLSLTTGDRYVIRAKVVSSTTWAAAWAKLDYMFESAGSSGWTTPPSWSSTCMAAASDLNTWRDDLNWLSARISQDNHGFGFFEAQTGDTQPNTHRLFYGYIKHTGSLLNFRYGQKAIQAQHQPIGEEEVWIVYNGSTAACTTCDGTHDWKYTTASFVTTGKGLVPGNFYEVYVEARNTQSYAQQVGVRLEYVYETLIISPSGWTAPRTFSHGDQPNSASMQTISDNLTSLHEERRDMNWPVRDNYFKGGAVRPSERAYGGVSFIHRAPWLHFLGSGEVIYGDNSAQFTDEDEDNPNTVWGVMNLDELTWLPRGAVYTVSGQIVACFESYDSS